MYLYGILGIIFAHIIVWSEIKELIKSNEFIILTAIELLIIAVGGVLGIPLFVIYVYKQFHRKKENNRLEEESLRTKPRMLNAGLFKLFLLKAEFLDSQDDEQLKNLNIIFESEELYAFLIVYNYKELDYVKIENIRSDLIDHKCVLLLLDINQYLDNGDHSEQLDYVYNSLSNTNYSFRSFDHEISASALSHFINIEIDGVNKLVVFNRKKPSDIYWQPISKFYLAEKKDFYFDSTFNHISLESSVYIPVANFMSLIWSKSKLEEYHYLKVIASQIKEDIILKYNSLDTIHITNIIKLVLTEDFSQRVMYSKGPIPTEDELKRRQEIAKYCILNSVEAAKIKYSEFSIEDIESIKRGKVNQILYALSREERNDFKARIFIKSSLLILEYIGREYVDYTSIVIGYAKFVEREINLSIVEGIRKHLGVKMPTYYSIYCNDGFRYRFKRGNFSVDYNKSDSLGNLLPPGLGQSFVSLSYLEEKIFQAREQIHFANDGILFSKIRNKCAHPELVSSVLLDEAETLISKFFIKGYFEEIYSLKESLSS